MPRMEKTLDITDSKGAKAAIPDLKLFGDPDTWKLVCKASTNGEGWMKSTKAMEIPGWGCVLQVTTQQRNPTGDYVLAEALVALPGTCIERSADGAHKLKSL